MARALWIVFAVAGCALVSVGGVFFFSRSDAQERRLGGPLACPQCAGGGVSLPVDKNRLVTFGSLALRNVGDAPATLERAVLLDVDSGIELADAKVVEPSGMEPLIGLREGFPPKRPGGSLHKLEGYVLVPARGTKAFVHILLGVRLTQTGSRAFKRVAFDYRVGSTRYRAIYRQGMRLCAPSSRTANTCPAPG